LNNPIACLKMTIFRQELRLKNIQTICYQQDVGEDSLSI